MKSEKPQKVEKKTKSSLNNSVLVVTLLITPVVLAATLEGSAVTATKDLTVHLTGTAYLSVEPAMSLMAGNHPAGRRIANWTAGVTAGTVAYRFNPNLVGELSPLLPSVGILSARSDSTQSINAILSSTECPSPTVSDGWMVCPEAVSVSHGTVALLQSQRVFAGTYLIAIDSVVWGF